MVKKPKTVMVVEDNLDLNQLLCRELRRTGFIVSWVYDGAQALSKIRQDKPDLLITDVALPVMNGLRLIEELENRSIRIGTVIISGLQSLNSDVYPLFEKPFSVRLLADFVYANQDTLSDCQLLKGIARRMSKKVQNIGKVVLFHPGEGWGLIRVIGLDNPLYVNASDVGSVKRFIQLFPEQIVEFEIDLSNPRGARARKVRVIFDCYQNPL